MWEMPGEEGLGGFDPQFMCPTPLVPVIRLSWGSDITPPPSSHSQKILFCTVEVNSPIYTANTH